MKTSDQAGDRIASLCGQNKVHIMICNLPKSNEQTNFSMYLRKHFTGGKQIINAASY